MQAAIDTAVQAAVARLIPATNNVQGQDYMVEEEVGSEDSDQGELGHRRATSSSSPWSPVLANVAQEPVTQTGLDLIAKLAVPLPLPQVRLAHQHLTRYTGVPESRSTPDNKLWEVQLKLEDAMHALVGSCEQANQDLVLKAAAFVRSAFQDVQEQRRWALARGQAWKLEKRPDATTATLLTKAEEDKIRQGRRPREPQRQAPPQQASFRPPFARAVCHGGEEKGKAAEVAGKHQPKSSTHRSDGAEERGPPQTPLPASPSLLGALESNAALHHLPPYHTVRCALQH